MYAGKVAELPAAGNDNFTRSLRGFNGIGDVFADGKNGYDADVRSCNDDIFSCFYIVGIIHFPWR